MKSFRVGEIEIACHQTGEAHQQAILLAHGFPLDAGMWCHQIEELGRDYHLIAPDMRGFGRSSGAADEISMATLADDLAGLLDVLGVRRPVAFCGLSMGGYVAWQFLRRHRDRLAALVLCDTRAGIDTAEAAANRRRMAEHVMEKGTRFLAEAMLPKLFAQTTYERNPESVEYARATILATQPRTVAGAQRGMASREDASGWLAEIDVPTLVVVGQHDEISPVDEMRQIAAAIPGAELVVVPEAAHLAPLENPEVVNTAIRGLLARVPGIER